jgi:hypothetical protein
MHSLFEVQTTDAPEAYSEYFVHDGEGYTLLNSDVAPFQVEVSALEETMNLIKADSAWTFLRDLPED